MFHDTLVPCAERRNINMKIIDKLKKVNLIQFVPAIFVISLVGNSVFGYTAPKVKSQKNAGVNQVEAATTAEKKKAKKANAGDIDLSKIKDGTYEGGICNCKRP